MHLEQSGLKMNALAVMADINPSLMYRMRDGLRPCSFENALKLHAVTNGRFSVEQTHPKALCLVKSIFKKQWATNLESPNGTEATSAGSCIDDALYEHRQYDGVKALHKTIGSKEN